MSLPPTTTHTALKRSVTKTADDENNDTSPLKRQASGEQRSILVISTVPLGVYFRYENDSSDDEEERDRRRKMGVIRNARIDEREARKDADAIRLF